MLTMLATIIAMQSRLPMLLSSQLALHITQTTQSITTIKLKLRHEQLQLSYALLFQQLVNLTYAELLPYQYYQLITHC